MNNVKDNSLPKLYYIADGSDRKAYLLIRRKPSQIPPSTDLGLIKLAGCSHNDGPNNRIVYDFFSAKRLSDAEDFLRGMGWEKISIYEDEMGDFWVQVIGNPLDAEKYYGKDGIKAEEGFETEEEAAVYLDDLMTGKIS